MQQENILALPEKRIGLIVFIILSLYPLIGMGIDLIAPSLPAISHNLQISHAITKNLIAIYLFAYALGNFCIGFLSDALGRRKLMLGGLFLFVLASLLPTLFGTTSILMLARFLQGFALAGFAAMGRAILSDLLEPKKLMHTATLIATMWGIGPIIGPLIGGYLQYYYNWQASFYFFAFYGLLGLIGAIFIVPETHFNRQTLNFTQIKHNFSTIITHRLFVGVVTLMGITYSLLIVFNTLGPFLIQNVLGHSSVYFGKLALLMGFAFLLGTFICRYFIKKYQPEKIIRSALIFFLMVSTAGASLAYFHDKNIWILSIFSLLMFTSCGIIYPASMAKGLALFRHLAGSGSAIMNLINILITGLIAFLMSFINADSINPIAWLYLGLMLSCGLVYGTLIGNFSHGKRADDESPACEQKINTNK